MGQNYGRLFQSWEIAIATMLIRKYREAWPCLKREDVDDLLQECLIHWLSAKEEYDPTRGASQKTFMGKVISNKLANLVQERQADKRKIENHMVSLSKPQCDDEDDLTLIDVIDERKARGIPSDVTSEIVFKMDLSNALEKLTPQQQKICELLKEGRRITEASKILRIHRSTIYDEIERIRKIFMKEGLKDSLK